MFIGASLSLKSLCCLRDGVRSGYPPWVPSVGLAASEKDRGSEKDRLRVRDEKERIRRGWESEREALAGAHRERYIFPGRVAVAKSSQRVGQTDDRRRASTALRTQKPRF